MSHDKIKAAARERMARTGEPYAAARRQVIAEIRAAAALILSCDIASPVRWHPPGARHRQWSR